MFKYLVLILTSQLLMSQNVKKIYTFSSKSQINDWRIVNDGVMGGISSSALQLLDNGYGKFSGHVALANNGGFASIQLNTNVAINEDTNFLVFHVKGDKKKYELRLKGALVQQESYVHQFTTSGEWQIIKIALNQFEPQYRGRKLNSTNFNFTTIAQISFLIANKREEDFELLIDSIGVE